MELMSWRWSTIVLNWSAIIWELEETKSLVEINDSFSASVCREGDGLNTLLDSVHIVEGCTCSTVLRTLVLKRPYIQVAVLDTSQFKG